MCSFFQSRVRSSFNQDFFLAHRDVSLCCTVASSIYSFAPISSRLTKTASHLVSLCLISDNSFLSSSSNEVSSHSRLTSSHQQSDFPRLTSRNTVSSQASFISSHQLSGFLVSRLGTRACLMLASLHVTRNRTFSCQVSETISSCSRLISSSQR